jgi:Flp pilus assembly protein TadD
MKYNSLATLLRKGEKALDCARAREAHEYLAQALEIDPHSITGHFYMALAKLKLGSLSAAEKHARTVLELNPTEGHAHLNLGIIREKRRDINSAKRHYRKEIKINPSSPHAYYNFGRIHFRRKEWKPALANLLQSYKRGGEAPFLVDDIAWAAYKSGDLRTEREIYKSVLKDRPRNPWALNNLAATYIDTHSCSKALPLLTAARKLRPRDAMIKRNFARCSKSGGQ